MKINICSIKSNITVRYGNEINNHEVKKAVKTKIVNKSHQVEILSLASVH